jgi:1-acyl-sn-glycerol-3-phosphate acyltransferase
MRYWLVLSTLSPTGAAFSQEGLAVLKWLLYAVVKTVCFGWFCVFNRLSREGTDHIPRRGAFILAANHCSNLDPVVVGAACPRRLRFMAKEELFRVPLLGTLIDALGAVPVPRSDRQGAAAVLRLTLSRLEAAESVLVFPEGTRSRDGRLGKLEGGVALLAIKTGLPVIPAFLSGTFEALPSGVSFPRPSKIRLRFGEPLEAASWSDLPEREARRAFLCALEERFRALESSSGGARSD